MKMYAKIIAFIFLLTGSLVNAQEPAVREKLSIAGAWVKRYLTVDTKKKKG